MTDFPPQDRPPVLVPFFAFRIMVGCGLVLLALAWIGSWLSRKGRLERSRPLLWLIFLSFPLPFVATLTGWYTAEIGRQPWAVTGLLRTADAVTPFLSAGTAAVSLIVFGAIYAVIFAFGIFYIHRMLRAGPVRHLPAPAAHSRRPLSILDDDTVPDAGQAAAGE